MGGTSRDFEGFRWLTDDRVVGALWDGSYAMALDLEKSPATLDRLKSEASFPLTEVGWKGFDPNNGTLTQTDHARVAAGRNYVDATATSGTIHVGGGSETLEVSGVVEPSAVAEPVVFTLG